MNYKNEKHRELFGEAVRRKDKKETRRIKKQD